MARKKNATEAKANGAAGANGSAAAGKPANKTEAVRLALGALGKKATPTEIDEHIRREFNVKMSLPHISTTKSNILRAKGKGSRRRRKKGAKVAAVEPAANAARAFSLKDLREIKALVDRVGVEKFKNLREFREVLDFLYP
jgi:hypothetical protein